MRTYSMLGLLILSSTSLNANDGSNHQFTVEPVFLHLRSGLECEWSDFPEHPDGRRLNVTFASIQSPSEQTLLVRQQDVKQVWSISLNGKKLGELVRDENDMVVAVAIPPETIVNGDNVLTIEGQLSREMTSDDIRVGQVVVVNRPVAKTLSESSVDVEVIDADSKQPLSCQITILNVDGALQHLGTRSHDHLAVRPGMAFTSTGNAKLNLPAGKYTLFVGRGFEYSLARAEISVGYGETAAAKLTIRREVPTESYVACDTHVHTLTHSGHGDSTIDERMITIVSEGIELPIATDHNRYIDYQDAATKMHVRRYFTPVVGNEVTTPRGHFNIFPINAGAAVVNHKQMDWRLLFDEIQQTPGVKVVILNHARDLHSGVRPFGPALYNAVVGENIEGWPLRFNAMEVINSGAIQSDPLRLFHDWMGLLNRGVQVTPVGSSDSHDVSRYLVGQGRTYVRCDDRDPGNLDVDTAVKNFVDGRVMVSYGLLTELTVNHKYRSGDTATGLDEDLRIDVRVLGPHWSRADKVELYCNGGLFREALIPEATDEKLTIGVKWAGGWTIPRPRHDVHLVAIATGPGIDGLYWRTARPYQPESPDWKARTIGCSGAVWLDVDGDRRRTSARDYAERLLKAAGNDWMKLVDNLSIYDEAVAAQAAHLLRVGGTSQSDQRLVTALRTGAPAVQSGFQQYNEACRANEIARAGAR